MATCPRHHQHRATLARRAGVGDTGRGGGAPPPSPAPLFHHRGHLHPQPRVSGQDRAIEGTRSRQPFRPRLSQESNPEVLDSDAVTTGARGGGRTIFSAGRPPGALPERPRCWRPGPLAASLTGSPAVRSSAGRAVARSLFLSLRNSLPPTLRRLGKPVRSALYTAKRCALDAGKCCARARSPFSRSSQRRLPLRRLSFGGVSQWLWILSGFWRVPCPQTLCLASARATYLSPRCSA